MSAERGRELADSVGRVERRSECFKAAVLRDEFAGQGSEFGRSGGKENFFFSGEVLADLGVELGSDAARHGIDCVAGVERLIGEHAQSKRVLMLV